MLGRRALLAALGAPALSWCQSGSPPQGILKKKDERTGREVWQVTSGPAMSHSCYFHAQPFTEDDRYLVYSSQRSGKFQLYSVDLRSEQHRQITDCDNLANMSFSVHTDGRSVIYLDGSKLMQTDVASARSRLILDLAPQSELNAAGSVLRYSNSLTFSADGAYTAVAAARAEEVIMGLLNLRTRRIESTIRLPGTGGHMLVCPAEPHLITYVRMPDQQNDMKLPMEMRARTMLADMRLGVTRPYLTMPYGWRATHEYWDARGERFYWHKKTVPGWVPTSICSMRRDGGDWRTHFESDTFMLGHSKISEDGRYIVSDVQKPKDNPLILIDLAGGAHEILCWPDSTVSGGHAKQAHVHPSFSRSGRFVAYTSDSSGVAQVYVVPVGNLGRAGA